MLAQWLTCVSSVELSNSIRYSRQAHSLSVTQEVWDPYQEMSGTAMYPMMQQREIMEK